MACAFCVQLKKTTKPGLMSRAKIYRYKALYLVFLSLPEIAFPATNVCFFSARERSKIRYPGYVLGAFYVQL